MELVDAELAARKAEVLRRLVFWFWHDLSHYTTALACDQLWWAYGALEELVRLCVSSPVSSTTAPRALKAMRQGGACASGGAVVTLTCVL